MAHEVQVEMEGDALPQPPAPTAEQQSMLGLSEAEVVNGTATVTLEAPLTDQTLVQGEGESEQNRLRTASVDNTVQSMDGCFFDPKLENYNFAPRKKVRQRTKT